MTLATGRSPDIGRLRADRSHRRLNAYSGSGLAGLPTMFDVTRFWANSPPSLS